MSVEFVEANAYAIEVAVASSESWQHPRGSAWGRLWFLVSAIPRYLITGGIKLA